jgi:hypothetical protein
MRYRSYETIKRYQLTYISLSSTSDKTILVEAKSFYAQSKHNFIVSADDGSMSQFEMFWQAKEKVQTVLVIFTNPHIFNLWM